MVKLLQLHAHHAACAEETPFGLLKLAWESPSNRARLQAAGARAVLEAIRTDPAMSNEVKRKAAKAILELAQ